jgi:hypothetical protein
MNRFCTLLLLFAVIAAAHTATAQEYCPGDNPDYLNPGIREYDSVLISKYPILTLPENYKNRSLPATFSNATQPWFPGISDQHSFFACQQYAGITYTFASEMNRLRGVSGLDPENRYPAHYTWTFMNGGEQYTGVNFIHSFDFIMNQGHMSAQDYGADTSMMSTGWVSGYDKYRAAMNNRLRKVYRIPITSAEDILTIKNYLYDHLDGSPTGGVLCYTTSSPNTPMYLPEGTPEAGKAVITSWYPIPVHGMTLVGWNDSIRWDYNHDGQYTNDIDLNGDSIIDARDRETGGFIFANSYGTWWANQGYCYVMYRAMVMGFEEGGVWNNCVFSLEPDAAYQPLVTMKVRMQHNRRNLLRVLAGVSSDPSHTLPDHLMEFPMFSYQGGPHAMQGFDTLPEQRELEFGLDLTPLLSYVTPGQTARFFLIIDENDPGNMGTGSVKYAGFISYSGATETFDAATMEVPLVENGRTILSATCSVNFSPVGITTDHLPRYMPGQAYSVQMAATYGVQPYTWSLSQGFTESPVTPGYQGITTTKLDPFSSGKPFAQVTLPFSFPFFGKTYDTVYINAYGMLQLEPQHLPYPFTIDEEDMLKNVPAIVPGFSLQHVISATMGDGMWMDQAADHVTFRWRLSVSADPAATNNEFELTLFPDGKYDVHYGPILNSWTVHSVTTGYSDGNRRNFNLNERSPFDALSGLSFRNIPDLLPAGLSITEEGLLTLSQADTATIYDIPVKVTDERGISSEKRFQLSDGLEIAQELVTPSGLFTWDEPAMLKVTVTNRGASALENVHLELSSVDSALALTDSTETIVLLKPGVPVVVQQAFAFTLVRPLPDRVPVRCRIRAITPGKEWHRPFSLTVSAPDICLTRYLIDDGVNGWLDPGETALLQMDLSNTGSLGASNLSLSLVSHDTAVTILTPQPFVKDLSGPSNAFTLQALVKASRYAPPRYPVELTLEVTGSPGISKSFPIGLSIGNKTVAILNLATSTTSVAAMSSIFDSLGLGYDILTELNSGILAYPVVFLVLGTDYSGSHLLSHDEAALMTIYLENGGKLYMESYATWHYGNNTLFQSKFKYVTHKVPTYTFQELAGVAGTGTAGMQFLYLGSSNYAIYEMAPVEPGFSLMQNTDTLPKCMAVAYAGIDYSTIGTGVEFGHLADTLPPSDKMTLMQVYLDLFNVNLTGPWPYFHAEQTHICRYHSVAFTDDSYDNITSWQWEFPGGMPSSSAEQNPVVQYDQEGDYDATLTVSDGLKSFSLQRKKYIHAEVCEGTGENTASGEIRFYPNPATDRVWIEIGAPRAGAAEVTLADLMGRSVRSRKYASGDIPGKVGFDLSGIRPGVYILKVRSQDITGAGKIVIK